MPLTSPAVHFANLEGTSLTLWNEWLRQWFDGNTHQVGRVTAANPAVVFPKAAIAFQITSIPQPLDPKIDSPKRTDGYHGVSIAVTMVSPGRVKVSSQQGDDVDDGGNWAEAQTSWFFTVRAQQAGTGANTPAGWNSEKLAQVTADRLFAITANAPTRLVLSGKGITHLRPSLPHVVGESTEVSGLYHVRQMSVRGTLRFRLFS